MKWSRQCYYIVYIGMSTKWINAVCVSIPPLLCATMFTLLFKCLECLKISVNRLPLSQLLLSRLNVTKAVRNPSLYARS